MHAPHWACADGTEPFIALLSRLHQSTIRAWKKLLLGKRSTVKLTVRVSSVIASIHPTSPWKPQPINSGAQMIPSFGNMRKQHIAWPLTRPESLELSTHLGQKGTADPHLPSTHTLSLSPLLYSYSELDTLAQLSC